MDSDREQRLMLYGFIAIAAVAVIAIALGVLFGVRVGGV